MFDRLHYEIRVMGWRVSATPPGIMAAILVITVLLRTLTAHGSHAALADFLTASIEMLLPLAAGVVVATVLTQDPAMELQLTLPRSYRGTALRRLGLIAGWTGSTAFLSAIGMFTLNLWRVPTQVQSWQTLPQLLGEQLVWLAPLLWFVGAGLCLGLLLRSPVISGATLSGIWLLEAFGLPFFTVAWLHPFILFPTTFAPAIDFWLANRFEVIGTALVFLLLGWWLLRDPSPLLGASTNQE